MFLGLGWRFVLSKQVIARYTPRTCWLTRSHNRVSAGTPLASACSDVLRPARFSVIRARSSPQQGQLLQRRKHWKPASSCWGPIARDFAKGVSSCWGRFRLFRFMHLSEVNKRGRPSKWPPECLPSKFADFECAFSL